LVRRNSELRPRIHDLSGFGMRRSQGATEAKFYALSADTGFFQHRDNFRNALFLGRCSSGFGSAMDLLIARRKFSTTDVTNMNIKVHDLSMCYRL
jgi:hypothetical protein